jgi:protein MYSM1
VSSFSLHVKRLTAPDRKADDGWTAVRHRGRALAELKAEALAAGLIPGYEATTVAGAAASGDEAGDDVGVDDDVEDAPVPIPAPPKLPAAPAEAPAPPRRASEGAARIIAAASPRRPSPPRAGSPEAAGAAATEYVRARPQRQRLAPQRLAPNADDQPLADDLQLVTAAPYADEAADAAAGVEDVAPLHVTVSSSAALVMDFHSHLSGAEVIGFLGGRWDASTRQLRVLRALPAAQLVSGDAAVEVELDPAGMPALLERLETEGLAVVGWYHSHPTFATQPSVRDIGNQGNYQRLFADAPFVGAIVGPWDAADDRGAADMRWFHVTPAPAAPGGARPRQLAARPEPEARVGAADVEAGALEPALEDAAREAAGRFAGSLMRTDFGSTWRTATAERAAMTRRDKLAASLRARIPEGADEAGRAAAEALVQRLLAVLDAAWAEHA